MTELYNKRKWLGQVTCEIILLLLSTGFRDTDDFINVAIPLLVPLFKAKDGNFLKVWLGRVNYKANSFSSLSLP